MRLLLIFAPGQPIELRSEPVTGYELPKLEFPVCASGPRTWGGSSPRSPLGELRKHFNIGCRNVHLSRSTIADRTSEKQQHVRVAETF
jgi:hypothetical protein